MGVQPSPSNQNRVYLYSGAGSIVPRNIKHVRCDRGPLSLCRGENLETYFLHPPDRVLGVGILPKQVGAELRTALLQ